MKRNILSIIGGSIIIHFLLESYFINIDRYSLNKGNFLSLFQDDSLIPIILNIISVVVILTLIFVEYKSRSSKHIIYSYAIFLIGGTLNLMDRIIYGGVIDYFHFFSISLFNFADCLIVFGIIVYILLQIPQN